MLTNYFTLHSIAASVDRAIRNKAINEAYCQLKDTLTISFEGEPRRLLIQCDRTLPTAYLQSGVIRARRNVLDKFPQLINSVVAGVDVPAADRVLRFRLVSGMLLLAPLYGPVPNVLLCDVHGNVQDSFKKMRPGKKAGSPSADRDTTRQSFALRDKDFIFDFTAFRQSVLQMPGSSAITALKRMFPLLGTTLALECFDRADVDPGLDSSRLEPRMVPALEDAVRSVLADLQNDQPRIYLDSGQKAVYFSLIPLHVAEQLEERRFEDISDAIHFFLARSHSAAKLAAEKDRLLTILARHAEKLRRAQAAMDSDLRGSGRSEQYEEWGLSIMQNLPNMRKGMRSFDAVTDHGVCTIPLEKSLSPVENAQRYFERSKRARHALKETAGRSGRLEQRAAQAERLCAAVEQCRTIDELKKFATDHESELNELGMGKKSRGEEEPPFRIFVVDGGFEVWAGKSSANNDVLTFRYAKPNDLWFHTRGTSGSHVVLRVGTGKGEPGKKAWEQAAAIAAYYSKMKGAGLVPVTMTERRHVRKPRGASPGTVSVERERVLFAKPALPHPAGGSSPGDSE